MKHYKYLGLFLGSILSISCDSDFRSYNDVEGFRVLALAAKHPQLLPGDSTQIEALVTEDAVYQWSWCPFPGPAETGYPCEISQERLQAFADEIPGPRVEIPSFDLGSDQSATLVHSISPDFFLSVCDLFLDESIPDAYNLPSCEGAFEVQLTLVATLSSGESIRSVTTLDLLLEEEAIPNQNPSLGLVQSRGPDGTLQELASGQANTMVRGQEYEILIDIDQNSSESYTEIGETEEKRENLTLTWFYQGGEMDRDLSAYIPGQATLSLETLGTNTWQPPTVEDHPESNALLHFVIRDNRGGTSWLSREIELVTL